MDDDAKTLAQYSVQDNGFIVMMTQKVRIFYIKGAFLTHNVDETSKVSKIEWLLLEKFPEVHHFIDVI